MTSTQAGAQISPESQPRARASFFAQRVEAPSPAAPAPLRKAAATADKSDVRAVAVKKPKPAEDAGDELGRLKRLGFATLAECLLSIPKAYYDYTKPCAVVRPELEETDCYLVLRAGETSLFNGKQSTEYWKG